MERNLPSLQVLLLSAAVRSCCAAATGLERKMLYNDKIKLELPVRPLCAAPEENREKLMFVFLINYSSPWLKTGCNSFIKLPVMIMNLGRYFYYQATSRI